MPEPDSLTTIGYLFTARDLASKVVTAAQKTVEVAEEVIEGSYEVISSGAEIASKAVGSSGKFIAHSFKNVVGSAFTEAATGAKNMYQSARESIKNLDENVKDFLRGNIQSFGEYVGDNLVSGLEKASAAIDFFTKRQFTWGEVIQASASGAMKFSKVVGSAAMEMGALGINLAKASGAPLKRLSMGFASAAVNVGSFTSKIFAIEKVTKVMKMGGGLIGALLGPFGPILSSLMGLFQPLIDIIVEMLSPAIETFTALLKPAFAPLAMLAEMLAQQLAPLIRTFIEPFASLLEVIAVQAASFVVGLLDTGKAMGPLGNLANKIFPILREIGQILMEVGQELLVDLMKAAEELAPILIDLFIDVLKAAKPLIKPLAELAAIMIGKVLPAAIQLMAHGLKVMVPVFAELVKGVAAAVTFINESLRDFFGDLEGHLNRFYTGFIEPILDWMAEILAAFEMKGLLGGLETVWEGIKAFFTDVKNLVVAAIELIVDALGFGDIDLASEVTSVFNSILAAVEVPLGVMKGLINSYLIDPLNAFLRYELPFLGAVGDLGIPGLPKQIPKLALGGIVGGPTPAIIGEAGPEAVVPLEAPAIEQFVGPIATNIDMPSVEKAVEVLMRIERVLNGTLKVSMPDGGDEGGIPSRTSPQEEPELDSALGMSGIGGGW